MNDIFIWQHPLWQKLTRNLHFHGHAILLKGKKGIGKYHFARYLAKSLLCVEPTAERKACRKCHSCGWFELNGHPNFHAILPEALAIDAAEPREKEDSEEKSTSAAGKKTVSQHIGIEQIRRLNDFVYMTGHQQGYKIVLIYPAEAMNPAAANALLKKLEEPPEQVLFILVTHQAQNLLPTIRSRCQPIVMPVPDTATSVAWLTQHGVDDPQACLAAAGFSPLSALQLSEEKQTGRYEAFLHLISDTKRFDPVAVAGVMQQTELFIVVNWLQQWCYDLISYRSTGKIRYFLNHLTAIKAVSAGIDLHACLAYSRTLSARQRLSRHPLNPRLFLEELLIDYAALVKQK